MGQEVGGTRTFKSLRPVASSSDCKTQASQYGPSAFHQYYDVFCSTVAAGCGTSITCDFCPKVPGVSVQTTTPRM